MRKIKFRGKRVDNGQWIEGYYGESFREISSDNKTSYIVEMNRRPKGHDIHKETVGEFTGLTDKNGKEIYEGDIVKVHIERADFITVVTWGKNSRGWKLKCDRTNIDRFGTIKYYSLPSSDRIEIIGNIHDNPEFLLK